MADLALVSGGVIRALGALDDVDPRFIHIISFVAMLALAGLDFAGSIFAREWAERHHTGFLLAGLLTFSVLFLVYAASLKVAELSIVTFGWIAFLQVGLVLVDTLHDGVRLPSGKWLAIAVLLLLQAYLVLAPNADTGGGA